jgi:phosphoenolpyruvate-protein kinase (PTS system EI component)
MAAAGIPAAKQVVRATDLGAAEAVAACALVAESAAAVRELCAR